MMLRIDGATSAKIPFSIFADLFSVTYTQGTGFNECAVFGVSSLLTALSALPWSAIIIAS